MPWRFIQLDGTGKTIDLVYVAGDGSCVTPVGFEVVEKSDSVELWALSRNGHKGACAAMLKTGSGMVTLQTPLGNRTLLHGPVSKQWSRSANALE